MRKQELSAAHPIGDELNYVAREAYNLLRANLSFTLMGGNGRGAVIAVTSACPGEGKSYTTVNLAYSLACAGHKVLLIDADMRRPSLCRVLKAQHTAGLSNILVGRNDASVAQEILTAGMYYIGAGDCPPNPSELIGSEAMGKFIDEMRGIYDYVLIDTPPVLAVSDCLALAKYTDGFLMVVRHGKTRRRDIKEAQRSLAFSGTKVLGFVYNGMPAQRSSRYAGYKYKTSGGEASPETK